MKKAKASRHGWIGTETVSTRLGAFGFVNSYPAGKTEQRLRDEMSRQGGSAPGEGDFEAVKKSATRTTD
jgi:hypothetical protein